MEGKKKNHPRCLMVFGAPCSGKTTFSEKFAEKFGLAYYNLEEIKKKNAFSHKTLINVLELILKTRQTIIVEGCLDTEKHRMEIRNMLRSNGYEPALIWIQTDVATIRARLKLRFHSVSKAKQYFDETTEDIEAPTELERPIILSGKHTFETQTKHAIAGLADLIVDK